MGSLTMEGLATCPLEESTALLKFTLRAAQAGSWAWDMVTDEVFWSEEYHHLVGTTPATCRPSYETWLQTIHPEDRSVAAAEMRAALDERRGINIEFRVVRTDGAVRWMRSQGQTLYGPQDEPLRMLGVAFDVTERKRAEEALQQREEELRIIANGVPALISYVDAEQRYQFNNERYEEWFGHSRTEIEGRHVRDVLGETAYEEILPQIEAALAGREARFEMWLDYQGVGRRCVEARYVPHFGPRGEVRGFFGLVNDITEHKKAEETLQGSDRRKDEFLAMLAHELRTPLAPIRHALGVMQQLGPHGSGLDRMLAVIERQAGQLTRLVDDLLDVSRISQGKITLHKEKIDLSALVARAHEMSRPLIDAGGHRLIIALPPEPLQIEGDMARLTQVLSNLLNNAAKYTEAGGTIWLTAEGRDNEIVLHVKDDGMGIPAEILPHIFDLFAQADHARDRAQGGLGIGLTLVKRIVERHGGTVEAFSAGPGQGSDFRVRLPRLA